MKERRQVEARFALEYRQAVSEHAKTKTDRSCSKTPEEVAHRRYAMWRPHLLADESENRSKAAKQKAVRGASGQEELRKAVQLAQDAWRLFGSRSKNPASPDTT
jgi:hypothetical protein